MKRKAISIFLAICMALTLMPVAVVAADKPMPFMDVPAGSWFYDAVEFAYEKELMSGTSSTTFGPLADLTRATVATVLYRMDGEPFVVEEELFSDVPAGEWYSKAVSWATLNGIVSGYGTNIFGTNDNITREQFATMLFRFASYMGYDCTARASLSKFTDAVKINTWAYDAMRWAVANEFITGTTPTTLGPGENANRAQCATILMKFCQMFVPDDDTGDDNIFESLTDVMFTFASGAGGWATVVTIESDGTFSGQYHDSEMGSIGPGYPYGTYYISNFSGRLVLDKKVNNFTYSLKLAEINVDGIIDEEKIVDGVKYITVDPYGFDDADEFLLYLPGAKTAGLPEAFIDWVRMPNAWSEIPDELPFYGLYNVNDQLGFCS